MKAKPRILIITPLPPPIHGASMVSKRIQESTLLNDEFKMDFVNLSTSRKIEEIQKKDFLLYLVKLCRFIGIFLKITRLLCTHHYSLCYLAITCHGTPFLKDFPFVMLCKVFRKKILIHQHNKGMSEDINRWPYRWAIPLAYRNTKVMLLSEHLYEDVSKAVKKEQILICPNGIPSQDFTAERRRKGIPHILFLSNLIETKGVFVLLEACKILKQEGVDFICDFVGKDSKDISVNQFKERIQSMELCDNVIYHGPKYGKEKETFWEQSVLFLLPTYNDCFPLVLLEAMQHNLPVVTTNEGGIPDIVIDGVTGYICEKENAHQLAAKIKNLLNNPSFSQEMGKAGYKRYTEHFTLECFERRISECLQKSISSLK